MHCVSAAGKTPDLNLPAFEFSFANAANSLVVQRVPSAEPITGTQDRQSIVKFDVSSHSLKSTLFTASKQTIGTLDDCVVG
jgi:hypothetical protein